MATFTIAAKPHRRARNTTGQYLACQTRTTRTVDGVPVVGHAGTWSIAHHHGVEYVDDTPGYWLLYGPGIDGTEWVGDPDRAVAMLRRRGLLAKAAS